MKGTAATCPGTGSSPAALGQRREDGEFVLGVSSKPGRGEGFQGNPLAPAPLTLNGFLSPLPQPCSDSQLGVKCQGSAPLSSISTPRPLCIEAPTKHHSFRTEPQSENVENCLAVSGKSTVTWQRSGKKGMGRGGQGNWERDHGRASSSASGWPRAATPGPRWGTAVLRHLPSGIVKVNEEPIIPEFGEHLVMVPVHISCKGGQVRLTSSSSPGPEAGPQLSWESEPRTPRHFPRLLVTVQRERGAKRADSPSCGRVSHHVPAF